jgi:hypothetical protein
MDRISRIGAGDGLKRENREVARRDAKGGLPEVGSARPGPVECGNLLPLWLCAADG